MREKLAAERNASRALLKEYNRNQAILQQLQSLLGSTEAVPNNLSFLTNGVSGQSAVGSHNTHSQPLTTNTTFALSQLPALKSLLAELRPKLAVSKGAYASAESAKDEMREERRGYIEQRTRSHLERNGENLQEDSAAISGRRVDPEEIQALEKVASIFEPA